MDKKQVKWPEYMAQRERGRNVAIYYYEDTEDDPIDHTCNADVCFASVAGRLGREDGNKVKVFTSYYGLFRDKLGAEEYYDWMKTVYKVNFKNIEKLDPTLPTLKQMYSKIYNTHKVQVDFSKCQGNYGFLMAGDFRLPIESYNNLYKNYKMLRAAGMKRVPAYVLMHVIRLVKTRRSFTHQWGDYSTHHVAYTLSNIGMPTLAAFMGAGKPFAKEDMSGQIGDKATFRKVNKLMESRGKRLYPEHSDNDIVVYGNATIKTRWLKTFLTKHPEAKEILKSIKAY